ncbi:hypothetical protein EV193_102334 [Herbihabitans rhizosphaerae]|uniref:Metalloprotease n=1 Tax=Herbihabitans rhizosphaerae TaxID=1872711 RepID=A0A4Q7L2C9_9PSEU|nr:hypothetical protein [Herbihabitans rhizosphaerae]RZS43355.1 hypothetical protein EV193_102334 [Herbihabitans rhizosphaerae]
MTTPDDDEPEVTQRVNVPDPSSDETQTVSINPPSNEDTQRIPGGPDEQTQRVPPSDLTQPVTPYAPMDQPVEAPQPWYPPSNTSGFGPVYAPEPKHGPSGRRIAAIVLAVIGVLGVAGLIVWAVLRGADDDNAQPQPAPPPATTEESTPSLAPLPTTEVPITTTVLPTTVAPPTTTPAAPPVNPLQTLAAHPLSTASVAMSPLACPLPRFNPDDQPPFHQAGKTCADAAWRPVLASAGLPAATVNLVIVQSGQPTEACGTPLKPTDPPRVCRATVYLSPTYLRDVEGNGRFPGRYFAVLLREYAHAVQEASGLTAAYLTAKAQGGQPADLERRYRLQATCMAGITAGAMQNQGAVDANITREIRDRLSTMDAPADAKSWLDKGFQSRQLSACNTWN